MLTLLNQSLNNKIIKSGSDGVINNIRGLLTSGYDNTSRMLINNLLKPFNNCGTVIFYYDFIR